MAKGNTEKMSIKAVVITSLLLVVGFGAVMVSLFNWQIVRGEELKIKAIEQSLQSTSLTSKRGTIYDSSGTKILAQSASVWTVVLEPAYIGEETAGTISKGLARILELDEDEIYEKTQYNSYFTYLKRRIETQQRDEILEFMEENDISSGIRLLDDYKRYYPYGTVAANVLGFTGSENQGLLGIEFEYDKELRGTAGRMVNAKNALGTDMPFQHEQLVDAENGYDLVLTIDETVQSTLEKYLDEGIARYEVANGAVAILMEVKTGGILGLATRGSFDPNNPFEIYDPKVREEIDALPEEEQDQAFSDALNKQWRNKAVSDTYYPGSVYKMCVGAMGIEEGAITADTLFYCGGSQIVEGVTGGISCWKHEGHGSQTFIEGLCNSCNPYFIQVGQSLGVAAFCKYREAFGMTEPTGIDLPGESRSIYHSQESMILADLAVESFGQNFSITPIQMITAACAVANGGYLVRPHVVDRILDEEGTVVKKADTSYKRQVISEETSRLISETLYRNATEGTAMNGYVEGYRVCGKTGTSEKVDKHNDDPTQEMTYIASYCGFAPVEEPQYALLVFFDEPMGALNGGNAVAGPIFSLMMEEILPYLNVQSQYTPEEYENLDKTTPNLIGKKIWQVRDELNQAGFTYVIVGDDAEEAVITEQIPPVGGAIPKNGKMILYTTGYEEILYTEVPDFTGCTYDDVIYYATNAGVQIITSGVAVGNGIADLQSIPAGERVKVGSVITVNFSDHTVNDLA